MSKDQNDNQSDGSQGELESVAGEYYREELSDLSPFRGIRRYLGQSSPVTFMVHAFVLFLLSMVLGFLAISSLEAAVGNIKSTTGSTNMNASGFFSGLSTLCRVSSGMLVAWAVGSLIADAIKEGSQS
ncbi:MAG: hypothetical protein ACWA5W_10390 [Phycisphaerales bacterium]